MDLNRLQPRVLLANEAGGGRGHVTKLAMMARAMGPELDYVAAIARPRYQAELAGLCTRVIVAHRLGFSHEAKAIPETEGNATWGDYLAAIGLCREQVVARGLRFWRDLIVAENISVLVADFAPLALRAAQGLREEGWALRIISTGTGYGVPPADLKAFPQLLDGYDRVVHPEPEILAVINQVAHRFDWRPLPHLAAIYDADLALPATFDFLDPYRDQRNPGQRFAPLVKAAEQLAGEGREIFVYFSANELENSTIVSVLEQIDLPRCGYLPAAQAALRDRLSASGMEIVDFPLTADQIARRARMILHSGSHGILALATLAGLPQLAMPRHLEQLYHARQAEAAGILRITGRDGQTLAADIESTYSDATIQAQARSFATTLRRDHPADLAAALAARLAPEVEMARKLL